MYIGYRFLYNYFPNILMTQANEFDLEDLQEFDSENLQLEHFKKAKSALSYLPFRLYQSFDWELEPILNTCVKAVNEWYWSA